MEDIFIELFNTKQTVLELTSLVHVAKNVECMEATVICAP